MAKTQDTDTKQNMQRTNTVAAQRFNYQTKGIKEISKDRYYNQIFADCHDAGSTWKAIKTVVSTGKVKNEQRKISVIKDDVEIEEHNVAEEFAKYFASVAQNIAENIVVQSGDSPNKYGTLRHANASIFLQPCTENEVFDLIQSLKSNKSAGIDGISAKTIKAVANQITPVLTQLINSCFVQGKYPDEMKKARVVPVYKAGEKTNINNYRPISVLPVVNTIVERAILNRLLGFSERANYLYTHQYGFRKKCGTRLALTEIIDMIQAELDGKSVVTGLFMDLSKAFDCVNHEILLYKLEMAGIRGQALELMRSYLTNRRLSVNVNGVMSSEKTINVGVP